MRESLLEPKKNHADQDGSITETSTAIYKHLDNASVNSDDSSMTLRYVHWRDGSVYLGYLLDFPDYMTQGETEEDLKDNLIDLYRDLSSGELPYVRKIDELVVTS